MKHLTDSMLSAIDRAYSKLGLLNSLLDKLVERVVPASRLPRAPGHSARRPVPAFPATMAMSGTNTLLPTLPDAWITFTPVK
jgi:hypothetical protein